MERYDNLRTINLYVDRMSCDEEADGKELCAKMEAYKKSGKPVSLTFEEGVEGYFIVKPADRE